MSHSSHFVLGSKESISHAFAIIDELHKNNQREKNHFKSFRSLSCSREDLKRSFYFLKDCIYFCKDESIYNNKDLLTNLNFLETSMILTYLDVDPNSIPTEVRENYTFGRQFALDQNLSAKQLSELELIDWRSKEQWQFWANGYGTDNIIGQYCLERANQQHY